MNKILNNPEGHFEAEIESRLSRINEQAFDGVKQIMSDDLLNDYSLLLDSIIQYLPDAIESKKTKDNNNGNKHIEFMVEKSEELALAWNEILQEMDFAMGKNVHYCI